MAAGDGCSKGTLIDSWICWQLYYHGHWGWSKTHSSNTYNDYIYIYNAVGGILNGSYDIWRFRWSKGIYAYVSGYVPSYNRWINNLWCLMMYIRRTISSCNILLSFATGQQSDWYNPVYGIFCSVWRVFFFRGSSRHSSFWPCGASWSYELSCPSMIVDEFEWKKTWTFLETHLCDSLVNRAWLPFFSPGDGNQDFLESGQPCLLGVPIWRKSCGDAKLETQEFSRGETLFGTQENTKMN